MSCHWDIVCIDCDDGAGFRWNRGEYALRDIHEALPGLVGTSKAIKATEEVASGCGWRYWGDHIEGPTLSELAAFAEEHDGHSIRLRNEYGNVENQCYEQVPCPTCGHEDECEEQQEHEGEHRREFKP